MVERPNSYSLIATPGETTTLVATDFLGSGTFHARISSVGMLIKVIAFHDQVATPPHFLDIWRDATVVTPTPIWSIAVKNWVGAVDYDPPDNKDDFPIPIRGSQFDFSFRHTAPYPGGTIFKPTNILVYALHDVKLVV